MARTVQSQRKSSRVAKPPRRVPAFHNAKRLVKTLPAMKSMKSSGRYEPGTRKGRPNTSTKWPKGVRRGKNFIVSSLVLIEIGARYIVKVTGKNSFEVLKRHR